MKKGTCDKVFMKTHIIIKRQEEINSLTDFIIPLESYFLTQRAKSVYKTKL